MHCTSRTMRAVLVSVSVALLFAGAQGSVIIASAKDNCVVSYLQNGNIVTRVDGASSTSFLASTFPDIPATTQVIGVCGTKSTGRASLAMSFEVDGDTFYYSDDLECVSFQPTGDDWLTNTFDHSAWVSPAMGDAATNMEDFDSNLVKWVNTDSNTICCRKVLVVPNEGGPCDETPGLCYPGLCYNNATAPDGYSCDCGDTGYSGPDCDIAGKTSGCQDYEMPWCQECSANSETDCIINGKWKACGNIDPVCQTDIYRDTNFNVLLFERRCVGRLECPNFSLGADFCEDFVNNTVTTTKCSTCSKSSCTDYCAPNQPLHCFTCHSYDAVGCWITGVYKECADDSVCFYTHGYNHTLSTGRMQVWRGCAQRSTCSQSAYNNLVGDCTTSLGYCTKCDYGSAFPNLPEKKLAICGEPSQGTCSCKGDPHCNTFDGIYIEELPGSCIYIFARDNCLYGLPIGDPTFVVSIDLKYLTNTKVSVHKVFVAYAGESIKMGQDINSVMINDNVTNAWNRSESNPLTTAGGAYITCTSGAIRVQLSNMVVIEWDFKKQVAVHVPNTFMMQMCGICGNFDMHSDMDFTFGPREAAIEACSPQMDALMMVNSGQKAMKGEEDLFALSWIDAEDHFDPKCHNDCHAEDE